MLHIHYRLPVKYIPHIDIKRIRLWQYVFVSILLITFVSRRYRISRYEFILDFMVCTALTVIIKESREMRMKYFWA